MESLIGRSSFLAEQIVAFDPSWNKDTVQLAYDSAIKSHGISLEATTAIDAKLVTVSEEN